jgi:RNA polymerase sigma factor (sigma-70 family)
MHASCGTNTELPQKFLNQCDACGFPRLVARHGPMVLRICQSILRDPHDAEDAFQLTFMVLLQKAGTITDPAALGRWLCGVAYKTAARVRRRGDRRRTHERSWAQEPADDRSARDDEHDLFLLVREELERLPEKYRSPLLLCYFEGLTHEEAAEHLGWASGTVKVRLVRGRKLLRERLDRRKIALGAGILLLWKREAGAAPAEALVDSTVAAVKRAAARKAVLAGRAIPRFHRAPGLSGRAAGSMISLAWALLLALSVVGGISWGVAITQFRSHMTNLTEDLPANLMNVLAVDCR